MGCCNDARRPVPPEVRHEGLVLGRTGPAGALRPSWASCVGLGDLAGVPVALVGEPARLEDGVVLVLDHSEPWMFDVVRPDEEQRMIEAELAALPPAGHA